jgi:TonB-linked SusC/RagA family outer membrane protein
MKKFLSIIIIAIFYGGTALAQEKVAGVIKDEEGQPVPGATVVIKGTTAYTVSDVEGRFAIAAPKELPFTLQVNFVGFKPQEVEIYELSSESADIFLKIDNVLNEVVVIGYDTRQRKDVIGSISKIDPIDVKNIPTGSFDAQLQGKVPGVQISSNTGVPGETVNVRVRGATSINADVDPLYIVDGVFVNNNSLQTISTGGKATSSIADLNPSDIESIEVLKDAAATALYGSRGANGVIIVTTKRGNYEQKPTINFSTSQGWTKAAKLWDLTTGPEHAELVNEWWINTGLDKPSLNQTYANRPFRPVSEVINGQAGRGLPEEQKTYDRLSQVFRTARVQNYDLSLQGGTQTTKYYIGGGYTSQESILRPITFNRASFKLNLDQKINDKITLGVSNNFSRTYRNQARAGDGPAGGLLQAALHTPTYLSPYNEQGQLVGRAGFDNVELLLENYDVHSRSLRYIGNLYAEAEILPGLKLRTSWGADYNNYDESEYWNTFLISGSPSGLATSNITQNTTLLNEQTLIYRKKINSHSLGILLGNTLQSEVTERTGAQGTGFANNSIKLISSASTLSASQSWSKATLSSFFSRIDYNFADKYLLEASLRADGSSRFGANNKWGYFPAVGAAWRLKEESFLKDVNVLSDLKLKASYGITGNQNFSNAPTPSLGLWTASSSYQGNPGIAPSQLANPNLKWEETRQVNVGLNASFINKRITLEFNVYDKYTKDGLIQVPVGATSGFASYWGNGIEVSNKGFEFDLQTINIERKDFVWTTSLNLARNVNKIEKLPTPVSFGSRNLILQKEGNPMYSFWVYKQLYVDSQTGNVVYEDVVPDGVINADDRQIYGSIWPKLFGGITNSVNYKAFDLSLFFAFQYGNKVYNHNKFFGEGGGARDAARVIFASDLARWQKPGDITDLGRPDGINNNNYKDGGSHWLEDGSFLRLRSLTIGYTLPTGLSQRLKLERLRLFVQGTNLWLLTNYTGLDPESAASSSQNEQGIDLGTPPQPRGLQVGLDIKL